jgi:signal transduction histidine kinase
VSFAKLGPSRRLVIIVLTASLIAAVSLLTFHLYRRGTREVLSQFQDHQISFATQLATQVEFFFESSSRELRALASLLSSESRAERIKTVIDSQLESNKIYINEIALYDRKGKVIHSTDSRIAGVGQECLAWAQKQDNRDHVFVRPASEAASPLTFVLATPIYSLRGGRGEVGQFAGVLSIVLNAKEFLSKQLGSGALQPGIERIWLVDTEGTLHFQPGRPEMMLRNPKNQEKGCTSCHPTFRYLQEVLAKKHGVTEYQVKGEQRKIAGFAPISFGNLSWIIVVTAPADRLTAFVWRSLRDHLFLLGIVLAMLTMGSALFVRQDRTKTRADEEILRWQEKSKERTRTQEALEAERNKLKGILDSIDDRVYIIGKDHEMIYVNPVIEKEHGPVQGRPCYAYLIGHNQVCPWCKAAEVFEGKTVRWEWQSPRTGRQLDLLETAYLGPDGTICKLTIARDITERKRAEETVQQSENQLRHLSQQLITAQETERKRISRELHDELGQALTVTKLHMNYIKNKLEKNQDEVRKECEDAANYIDEIIENVRRLSRELSPAILEDFGLSAATRWLATNFAKMHGIKVSLDLGDLDLHIPARSHTVAYRIVQEALTNIVKHAEGNNISVTVTESEGLVSLNIADDGRGFDMTETSAKGPGEKGLGIATMKAHADMLGGTLAICSEIGKGSRIVLTIPAAGTQEVLP